MTIEVLSNSVGDLDRFGVFRERVEVMVDDQVRTWASGTSGWLVLPLQRRPQGFYLVSENQEGQRRGREVLQAFLGPSVASIESIALTPSAGGIDEALRQVGLSQLSLIRRTARPAEDMLDRLDDAIATLRTKDARPRPVHSSHIELLRDFRLSLQQRDTGAAQRALDSLRLTGYLSAENIRFLTVEMHRRLERWRDLRDLPYLTDLLRARRPRATNEALLEMLWWTEVADRCASGQPAQLIYSEADLGGRFGAALGAVDVPDQPAGRAVAFIAALALNDADRGDRVLAAADQNERNLLHRLLALGGFRKDTSTLADTQSLFDDGQFSAVVRMFTETAEPTLGDLAVQAILESEDSIHAATVLAGMEALIAAQQITPGRRLTRDIAELRRLVSGSCSSWTEWCTRLLREERWPDAAQVLRTQCPGWGSVSELRAADIRDVADALLGAWAGVNQDQIVTALDLLCGAAADTVVGGQTPELCEVVLLVLSEQQNLSAPVREAYLVLLEHLLQSGPSNGRYTEIVKQADELWQRIAAPAAVDWGISLMDVLLDTPSPVPSLRASVGMEFVNKIRNFRQRLTARQQSDAEALAEELGLPVHEAPDPTEDDVWHQLDGRAIGVYSLMPRAVESLQRRLSRLCSPSSVDGNADTVSTPALRALVSRVDFLIVDTWHAAHAATGAIDAMRPRNEQILPRGHGVTGFMQALEDRLGSA